METSTRRSVQVLRIVRGLEAALALLVVVTAALWLSQHALWERLVSGPDLWPLFVQLGVPALLGVVVIVGAVLDGLEVGSVLVAVLGLVTLWIAASSVHTLLFPPEGGGVFFGGIFTMYAGLALALAVGLRTAGHRLAPVVLASVRERLENR